MATSIPRPELSFIPLSTDPDKIRFFGTLMPNLLLIFQAPREFANYQWLRRQIPNETVSEFIRQEADDAAHIDDIWLFIHRWHRESFDPVAFARANAFLARLAHLFQRDGYQAEPLGPLSPEINLPQLAAQAGLGNLSPYGLLVHPRFGPRVIISGMRTKARLPLVPRYEGESCSDCMVCLRTCPQKPLDTGQVDLGLCQRCALCLSVCPVGKRA